MAARLAELARKDHETQTQADEVRAEFRQMITDARGSGMTWGRIAEVVGDAGGAVLAVVEVKDDIDPNRPAPGT